MLSTVCCTSAFWRSSVSGRLMSSSPIFTRSLSLTLSAAQFGAASSSVKAHHVTVLMSKILSAALMSTEEDARRWTVAQTCNQVDFFLQQQSLLSCTINPKHFNVRQRGLAMVTKRYVHVFLSTQPLWTGQNVWVWLIVQREPTAERSGWCQNAFRWKILSFPACIWPQLVRKETALKPNPKQRELSREEHRRRAPTKTVCRRRSRFFLR